MDELQIENRLEQLDRKLNIMRKVGQLEQAIEQVNQTSTSSSKRETQSPSRINRWMLFIVITLLIVFVLSMMFFYRTFERRLGDLESDVQVVNTSLNQPEELTPIDEISRSLDARLTSLETLQEAIVSTSKGALEQMTFIFTIVAAFFGLFSLYFAYRQITTENNREVHDAEMRSLVASFHNNINTISSLINTLEQSYDYREKVENQLSEMQRRAASLEKSRDESDITFTNRIAELNADAVRLFKTEIDRAALSREENRRKLDRFANRMNSAGTIREVENLLNPFCYYLRGLHNIATYQYELAISDLEVAHKKGRVDLVDPRLINYAEHDRENVMAIVEDMVVSCSHFQGVGFKNLGRYEESRKKFQDALERDPSHYQSRTYLLQVMYFDSNVSLATIESEYDKVVEEFEHALNSASSLDERKKMRKIFSVLKVNQGNMYLRKLIALSARSDHKEFENREKALRYYQEAYDYIKPYSDVSNYVAAFSVAQAIEDVGSSVWDERSPTYFYQESLRSLKKRVAEDHDPLYSVLLYYMIAICENKIDGEQSSAGVFLSQARHSLKEVPSNATCFSPISKVRLSRNHLLEEMDRFEEAFLGGIR
ncbi:MAG: hypothetical protein CL608_23780 [Anaerolineaceae bacterium]|nr:hypothetical protein [Anaerolineaceae bacterium]